MEEQIKRIPPHDKAAERSVLGAMLLNNDIIVNMIDLLTPEDFYERRHGTVFEAIASLSNSGKSADIITLNNKLKEMGVPENVSDIGFIGELVDAVPNSANAAQYAEIVRDKALLRRLIKAADTIEGDCYQANTNIEEIVDRAEKQIFNIAQNKHVEEFTPIDKLVEEALEKIQEACNNKGQLNGISTGFKDLDDKTSGLQKSDFILIAARPSMGKTALAMNIGQHVAMRQKITTAVFSLEMSKEQLIQRMLASTANVSMQDMKSGNLSSSDFEEIVNQAMVLSESKLIIDDTSGITIRELSRKCRKYKMEHDLGLIIIDYLQLMGGSGKDNRQQEISDISRALKQLARELQVPVISLSQLSRAVEQRKSGDHRPMLSDLRESGAIEQDADVVMFIYREDYYKPETDRKGIAEVIIAKQRNGPIGPVELRWIPQYTKFANLAR